MRKIGIFIVISISLMSGCPAPGSDAATDHYTVTYDANGAISGTVIIDSNEYLPEDEVTVLGNIGNLEKSGSLYNSWNTEADGSGTHYSENDTFSMPVDDVVLYAEWVAYGTEKSLELIDYSEIIQVEAVTDDSYIQQSSLGGGFIHNISAFSLGKYEVTYELWYTVYEWSKSHGYDIYHPGQAGSVNPDPGNQNRSRSISGTPIYEPVTEVAWGDCIVWCNAYSEMTDSTPAYYSNSEMTVVIKNSHRETGTIDTTEGSIDNPYVKWDASGYRLPTEGEWQLAASCKGTYEYNYPSGSDAEYAETTGASDTDGDGDVDYTGDLAWYNSNSNSVSGEQKTQNVGLKKPNINGFYDMSGNAAEWCWDITDITTSYPSTAQDNYKGREIASDTYYRISKSGYFLNDANSICINDKYRRDFTRGSESLGFRIVQGIE